MKKKQKSFTMKWVKKILLGILIVVIGIIIGYYGFMWFTHDFSIHFLQIDSCLDSGWTWDSVVKMCR